MWAHTQNKYLCIHKESKYERWCKRKFTEGQLTLVCLVNINEIRNYTQFTKSRSRIWNDCPWLSGWYNYCSVSSVSFSIRNHYSNAVSLPRNTTYWSLHICSHCLQSFFFSNTPHVCTRTKLLKNKPVEILFLCCAIILNNLKFESVTIFTTIIFILVNSVLLCYIELKTL